MLKTKKKETRVIARNQKLWLDEAINILLKEGPRAVSVKRIAKRLGTSRSPFFRAFGNYEELLRKMFDFYQRETTDKIIETLNNFPGTPFERFWHFWITIIEINIFLYDYPFRQWALIDPVIGKLVHSMDEERMKFICEMFQDLGYSEEEANHRASFAYYEYIGILVKGREEVSPEWLKRRAMFRFYLLTAPPMSATDREIAL